MSLARQLWCANADLVAAAVAHPFVRGLADGSLPPAAYAGYIGQDAFFLDTYARAYEAGIRLSPDRASSTAFAGLLAGVGEERRLHEATAAREGIDLAAVEPVPATLAYRDFLLAAAGGDDLGVLCAATTPCTRLYAHLGSTLEGEGAADHGYRAWVETYAAAEMAELAVTLEGLLDRHGVDADAVRTAYRRAMELELGFFDAALAA